MWPGLQMKPQQTSRHLDSAAADTPARGLNANGHCNGYQGNATGSQHSRSTEHSAGSSPAQPNNQPHAGGDPSAVGTDGFINGSDVLAFREFLHANAGNHLGSTHTPEEAEAEHFAQLMTTIAGPLHTWLLLYIDISSMW